MKEIYTIQWLSLTNNAKKDLILIMMRASRPMKFMGIKVIEMSVDTFVKVRIFNTKY